MTTARGLLRRLIARRRAEQRVSGATAGSEQVEDRLDAARTRLKQTIPSPEDPDARKATPPPEGVSPGQESPPVP